MQAQNSSPPPFSWQIRADLFAQLAAMEKSGLPIIQAFGLLRLPPTHQSRVAMTKKWLERGNELSIAGQRSGLFTEMEANLIGAATSAGSPASIYKRLAEYYAQRAAQGRTVKTRLVLPAAVLIIGLFVQPLPALFGGTLSLGGYLFRILSPLVVIALLILFLKKLLTLNESAPSSTQSLAGLVMTMPLFGKTLIRRNLRDYFESLALMLEAGMPILQALPKALNTIRLNAVKQAFSPIQSRIEQGSTLTQALADIPYIDQELALGLIHTGEASGKLPEMLFRYAAMETTAINDFDKQMAEWLPRLIYAAVAAWVAYGLLTGPGFGPRLPADLL
ncbi:MAG: type II secretion system F family protein [Burkholderiales bacterium]|nr:type II secretion system F family protein [Burkholderiales bacterium]